MEFVVPATKEQLYDVLKEISDYYKGRESEFTLPDLEDLVLEKIEFTPKTAEELVALAENMTAIKKAEEKRKIEEPIDKQLFSLTMQKSNVEDEYSKALEEVEENYRESVEKVKTDAVDRGIYRTEIITER